MRVGARTPQCLATTDEEIGVAGLWEWRGWIWGGGQLCGARPRMTANERAPAQFSTSPPLALSRSLPLLSSQEMCAQMYYRGKMFGFVHLYSGQEAVSTGVIR